jgi:two-component system C4-dicarboxylate transport sensor histidine kinase DctB
VTLSPPHATNSSLATPAPALLARQRRAWRYFAAASIAALAVVLFLASHVGEDQAVSDVRARAQNSAALKVAVLMSELEKQRSLPFVLAQDVEVQDALRSRDPARLEALDAKLFALKSGTGAAVIYLIDPAGITLAASNWREPTSFVGSDYGFRPYFQEGVAKGAAEHFALGNVSQRPGLYLTRRVDRDGLLLGVVVVKVEFNGVEDNWRRFPEPTFVTDENGVVLLSAVPAWQFMTLGPLPDSARARLRDSLQFGDAPLQPLPIRADPDRRGAERVLATVPGTGREDRYVQVSLPVPSTRWTFHFLGPTQEPVARAATLAQAVGVLIVLLSVFAAGLVLHRRHLARNAIAAQTAVREELERRVAARTAELRDANAHLVSEMDDRRRAEAGLQQLQEELEQANKLAFLGQITAGVAHEINQPVAAIRSFADNAATFLDRAQTEPVRRNLASIAGLTQRIGAITDELRAFSRKGRSGIAPTRVAAAIDGALLLVGNALHRQGVTLIRPATTDDVWVMGERMRLEQVLVNLLQNGLDALEGVPDAQILLSVSVTPQHAADGALPAPNADCVRIDVADNGPGIAPDVMAALFTPFTTTKPNGLGLGLVISRDIAADFGGELQAHSEPGVGTRFTLLLQRARPS